MNNQYDVVIIGSGPGGYVAAIRAAQLKLKTAIIEKDNLGGICLNWGCIPTKALLRSAEVLHLIKNASEFGINVKNVSIDFPKIISRSRNISSKLASGIAHLLKKNNITVYKGTAKLINSTKISVSSEGSISELSCKNIIIATGARAREVENIKPDGINILTYKEAMTLADLPKSLLVVGSGAIGVEFASFYNLLGSKVDIVEVGSRILNAEDEEISLMAHKSFEKQGIKIDLNSQIKVVSNDSTGVKVEITTLDGNKQIKVYDKIISAVGVVANVENIGLEKTKINLVKNCIETNGFMQTKEPNIYAIGDVTSAPWLAHKASHEGVLAAEHIAKTPNLHPINKANIPGCTYSYPQIASVGLSEKKAIEQGYQIKVGKFPFSANGKAIAMGETEGIIKVIFCAKTGELLGAHMLGAEVTEMIQGFTIGKTLECTEQELMATVFPHPTLSEMMHESVLSAFGKTLNF